MYLKSSILKAGRKRTIAKDKELVALSGSNLRQQREQVVGDTLGVLAHDATGVGSGRIEITQQGAVPFCCLLTLAGLGEVVSLGVNEVCNGKLDGELCVSVRVGRTQGALLGDGDHVGEASGVAVDGSRAREDNVVDIVLLHGAEEVDCAVDIDKVVVEGFLA